FHPDQLVIAGIVVFGEVNVVLPEEVVCDETRGRVQDHGEIFEREKLGRRGVKARGESANKPPFLRSQFARRAALEGARVFTACVVETSSQMVFDASLMVELSGVCHLARFL